MKFPQYTPLRHVRVHMKELEGTECSALGPGHFTSKESASGTD